MRPKTSPLSLDLSLYITLAILLSLKPYALQSQTILPENSTNPICGPGVYIADPSAKTWDNETLYLYGSTDESCDYYCTWHHDILSTQDFGTWNIFPEVIRSKGENDQIPYNDNLLFAPDCEKFGEEYVMFYCQPGAQAEGTATSASPEGPFIRGKNLDLHGHNQIDPAVFIDDDGEVYYLWGQFSLKMARFNPKEKAIYPASIREDIISEDEHFFHEGAMMIKRNGLYYLVYSDISRKNTPSCLGYATSTNPFGPYKYGGVIIDNDGCNPGNWNNHGSLVEFKDQWYIFYHRSTHGCNKMRKTCVEKISFNPDGSIPEVEMTTQGAGDPLNPKTRIDAAVACQLHGNLRIVKESAKNEVLSEIKNGDAAIYKYLDFTDDLKEISIRFRAFAPCRILFHADMPWSHKLGEINIDKSAADGTWKNQTVPITSLNGVEALWISFKGEGEHLLELDHLHFE